MCLPHIISLGCVLILFTTGILSPFLSQPDVFKQHFSSRLTRENNQEALRQQISSKKKPILTTMRLFGIFVLQEDPLSSWELCIYQREVKMSCLYTVNKRMVRKPDLCFLIELLCSHIQDFNALVVCSMPINPLGQFNL